MCLNLSLILSHVPAPKAHTSQGTIHGYDHSWNNLAQPDADPPCPLLPHHPAATACPPSSTRPAMPADPARQARRPCPWCPSNPARNPCKPSPPCPPTLPAVPADPACHARRPCLSCLLTLPANQPTCPAEPTSWDMSTASAAMQLTQPASYLPASCSSAPVRSFPVAAV